jgi:hypothetical protein
MPITLVTGPANSGKAGEVLGRYRARLDDEALLVVPRFEDVEHTRRELAATGVVFGARVVRFSRALELASERAGVSAFADTGSDDPGARRPPTPRVASRLQRELVMEEAVRAADLRTMAASARGAGFPRAALRLVDELQRAMVEPERLAGALEAWGRSGGAGRRRYADEIAKINTRMNAGR